MPTYVGEPETAQTSDLGSWWGSMNASRDSASSLTLDESRCRSLLQLPDATRTPGPNELIYIAQHRDFVENRIQKHRNYQSLSQADQRREQVRVTALLRRLGISGPSQTPAKTPAKTPVRALNDSDETVRVRTSERSRRKIDLDDDSRTVSFLSQAPNDSLVHTPAPHRIEASRSPMQEHSIDMLADSFGSVLSAKLTPISTSGTPPAHSSPDFPLPDDDDVDDDHHNNGYNDMSETIDSSTSSIEVTRRSRLPFASPDEALVQKKRMASASGKRGADTSRPRFSSLEESIGRLSLSDAFPNSQSPIPLNDTIESSFESDRRPFRDIRNRKVHFYQPLDVERTKHRGFSPTQSFPDPLRGLGSRVRHAYEQLEDRSAAVVLGLNEEQWRGLLVKTVLDNPPDPDQSRGGRILIVAREKEELDNWSRSFREGTPYSVLNHASVPARDRSRRSTLDRYKEYDIVLTTFDALKSTDVTVSLNDQGHAKVSNEESQMSDCWYASRSQASQSCKKLSLLHLIRWQHVCFTDTLGKKSYTLKHETTRSSAAQALEATKRFVFFSACADDQRKDLLLSMIKSHKTSLVSLASILRLANDSEAVLHDALVDCSK